MGCAIYGLFVLGYTRKQAYVASKQYSSWPMHQLLSSLYPLFEFLSSFSLQPVICKPNEQLPPLAAPVMIFYHKIGTLTKRRVIYNNQDCDFGFIFDLNTLRLIHSGPEIQDGKKVPEKHQHLQSSCCMQDVSPRYFPQQLLKLQQFILYTVSDTLK